MEPAEANRGPQQIVTDPSLYAISVFGPTDKTAE